MRGTLRLVRVGVALGCLCGLAMAVTEPRLALALPSGHEYEMVSPVYKGGDGVNEIEAVSESGGSVAFWSLGAFGGEGRVEGTAPSEGIKPGYLAHRGAAGWSTVPLTPPMSIAPSRAQEDFSPSLGTVLVTSRPGPNVSWAEAESVENDVWLHATERPDVAQDWELAGETALKTADGTNFFIGYEGASTDFCQIVFSNSKPLVLPEGDVEKEQMYDFERGCGGTTDLRAVSVDNAGHALNPLCPVSLGDGGGQYAGFENQFNAVSSDGASIFYTIGVGGTGNPALCTGHSQLFVRVGNAKTIEVSRPLTEICTEVPCEHAPERLGAAFVGASEDGSRAFLTTKEQLVVGESDSTDNLFMASIGCPGEATTCLPSERQVNTMTRVSKSSIPAESADVQGVIRVAPDGSRVYFVAGGVLTEGANGEGRTPRRRADNLYVYDVNTGRTSFIADLCSGAERSGELTNVVDCPDGASDAPLWTEGTAAAGSEAQTAGADGRFLVFTSYGRLTSDDTETARSVFRYDAAEETLVRASLGEDGYADNGNTNVDASIAKGHLGGPVYWDHEMNTRAISEDGSRIVFTTAGRLSQIATNKAGTGDNGIADVYEWRVAQGESTGQVSLISGGDAGQSDEQPVISPTGEDVFFTTVEGLVAGDKDGQRDVYDAHECTDAVQCFPPSMAENEPCGGSTCLGPLSSPVPLLLPGSEEQAPEALVPATVVHKQSTSKPKPVKTKKKRVAKRKRRSTKGVRARHGATKSARGRRL